MSEKLSRRQQLELWRAQKENEKLNSTASISQGQNAEHYRSPLIEIHSTHHQRSPRPNSVPVGGQRSRHVAAPDAPNENGGQFSRSRSYEKNNDAVPCDHTKERLSRTLSEKQIIADAQSRGTLREGVIRERNALRGRLTTSNVETKLHKRTPAHRVTPKCGELYDGPRRIAAAKRVNRYPSPRPPGSLCTKKAPVLLIPQHSTKLSTENRPESMPESQRMSSQIDGCRQDSVGEENGNRKNDEELVWGREESENTVSQKRSLLQKELEQMKAIEKILAEQKSKVQAIQYEEQIARKREEEALAMRKVHEEKIAKKAEVSLVTTHEGKADDLPSMKVDKELAKAEERITKLLAELESVRAKAGEEELAKQEAMKELAKLKDEYVSHQVVEEQNQRSAEEKMAQLEAKEAKDELARLEAEYALQKVLEEQSRLKSEQELAQKEAKEAKEELARLKAEYALQKVVEEQSRLKAEQELGQKEAELKATRRKVEELEEIQAEGELIKKKEMDKFARQNVHEGLAKRKAEEELARIEAEFAMHKAVEKNTRLELEEELEQHKTELELALEKANELAKMLENEKVAKEKAMEELAWQKVKEETTKRNEEKIARQKAEEEELIRKKKECRQQELAKKKAEEQELNRKKAEERQKELAKQKHEEEVTRNKAEQEEKRRKERERLKELSRKKAEEKELAKKKAEIDRDIARKKDIEEELVRKKSKEAEEKHRKKRVSQTTFPSINMHEEDKGKNRRQKIEEESTVPTETEVSAIRECAHETEMTTERISLWAQQQDIVKTDAATSPVNVSPTRLCIVGFLSPRRLARRIQTAECAESVDEEVGHTIRIAQDLHNQIDYLSAKNENPRNPANSPEKGVIRGGMAWSDVALHRARAAVFEEDLRQASASTFEFTPHKRASLDVQKVPSPQRSAPRSSLNLSDLDSPTTRSVSEDPALDTSNSVALKLSDLRSVEEPCYGHDNRDVSVVEDALRSDVPVCVEKKKTSKSSISPFSYSVSPIQDEARSASSSSSARAQSRPPSSPRRSNIPRLRNICNFCPEEDAKPDSARGALQAQETKEINEDPVKPLQKRDGVMLSTSPKHTNFSDVSRFGPECINEASDGHVDRCILDSPGGADKRGSDYPEDARRDAIRVMSLSPLAPSSVANTPPAIDRSLFENHAVASDSPRTCVLNIFDGTRDDADAPAYGADAPRNFFDTSPRHNESESVHVPSGESTLVPGPESTTTEAPTSAETLVAGPKSRIRYTVASDVDANSMDRTPPHEEKTPRSLCISPPRRRCRSPSPSIYSSPPDVAGRLSGDSDFFQRLHEDDAASGSFDEDNVSFMSYPEPLNACSDEEYLSRMKFEIHRVCQGSSSLHDRDYMVRETDLSTEELLCRAADVDVFYWFDRRVQISNVIQYESKGNLETIPEYPPTMTQLRRRTCDLQLLV